MQSVEGQSKTVQTGAKTKKRGRGPSKAAHKDQTEPAAKRSRRKKAVAPKALARVARPQQERRRLRDLLARAMYENAGSVALSIVETPGFRDFLKVHPLVAQKPTRKPSIETDRC